MSIDDLESGVELAANLYGGIEFLQLLLWRCQFANYEADMDPLLECLEGAMREYVTLANLRRIEGFGARINEQSIEQVSMLRRLVAEWTRTGTMSPELESLTRDCLERLLGPEAASRLGSPRPSNVQHADSPAETLSHAVAVSNLVSLLGASVHHRRMSPGGWVILTRPPIWCEPEPAVPDLAAWRAERFQSPGTSADMPIPDWVCEVLSPLTELADRGGKVRDYIAHRVRYGWWIDPIARSLEVFRLEDDRWSVLDVFEGNAKVRAEPFDAIELDLSLIWTP